MNRRSATFSIGLCLQVLLLLHRAALLCGRPSPFLSFPLLLALPLTTRVTPECAVGYETGSSYNYSV